MEDEYSDEDFAADDAEPAYDAEFDDFDDDDIDLTEPTLPVDHLALKNETANQHGEVATKDANEEDARDQESYEFEFDDRETEIVGASEAPTPATKDVAIASVEGQIDLQPSARVNPFLRESEIVPVPVAAVSVEKAVAPFLGMLAPIGHACTNYYDVLRRSSDSQMFASTRQIERFADPELESKLMRRRSSPRVRPTPIARLASVGELTAAASDELEVATNEVTEEAAAVVRAAVAAPVSLGLVKRPSSRTFVSRLPSLGELSCDLPGALESGTRSVVSREQNSEAEEKDQEEQRDGDDGNEGSKNDQRERNEVDNVQANLQVANGINGDEESCIEDEQGEGDRADQLKPSQGHPLENPEEDTHSGHFGSDESEILHQTPSHVVLPASDAASTHLNDGGKAESSGQNGGYAMSSAAPEHCRVEDVTADGSQETEGLVGNEGIGSNCDQVLHSPSNHADESADRLKPVMPEFDSSDVGDSEDSNGGNVQDEFDAVSDADDGSRRETNMLLQETQGLIDQHETDLTAVRENPEDSTNNNNCNNDHQDVTSQYTDEPYGGDGDNSSGNCHEDDTTEELAENTTYNGDIDVVNEPEQPRVTDTHARKQRGAPHTPLPTAWIDTPRPAGRATETPSTSSGFEKERHSLRELPVDQSPTKIPNKQTSPAFVARASLAVSKTSKDIDAKLKRLFSQGSTGEDAQQQTRCAAPTRRPDIPKMTPKAPVPRQPHRVMNTPTPRVHVQLVESPTERTTANQTTQTASRSWISAKPPSPTKSEVDSVRSTSPTRKAAEQRPSSPSLPSPRKPLVIRQRKPVKGSNPDAKKKKLKPVKCPPNIRIDLPHVDKVKREWLLLNMFRHGDDTTKYEPFIPTMSSEHTAALHFSAVDIKRPLSASHLYDESDFGGNGRHTGRKIVNPNHREREQNWVSSNCSVSTIPAYDSILDKHCKTVTSPIVQRRIYETRMGDLSPQLAMVLEKRAFKEWKQSESDGFGAVSLSYKTAVVGTTNHPHVTSAKVLYTPHPPSTPSGTLWT